MKLYKLLSNNKPELNSTKFKIFRPVSEPVEMIKLFEFFSQKLYYEERTIKRDSPAFSKIIEYSYMRTGEFHVSIAYEFLLTRPT